MGLRGPGEKQLEMDKRMMQAKVTSLKRQLEDVRRHRKLHRRRRDLTGLPLISLIG